MRRAAAVSVSRGNLVQDLLDRAKLLFVAAIVARSLPARAWSLVHPWSCIALDHGPRNQSGAFEAWPASHVAALMLAAAVALLGSRGHSRLLHGFNHRAAWFPDVVLAETGPRAGGSIRYVRYRGYQIDPRPSLGLWDALPCAWRARLCVCVR